MEQKNTTTNNKISPRFFLLCSSVPGGNVEEERKRFGKKQIVTLKRLCIDSINKNESLIKNKSILPQELIEEIYDPEEIKEKTENNPKEAKKSRCTLS